MSFEDTLVTLPIIISLGIPILVFVARNWLAAWITKGIQHRFDLEIEQVRTEMRRNEERLKHELRDKEAEIALLRSAVLTGSAGRQSLLDKRRFEAVERVWVAVNDLARYKMVAAMMAVLKFKEIAKESSDPKIQRFLATIEKMAPDVKEIKNVARDEQPFLPELAWAYFSAYMTILTGSYMRLLVLKSGVNDPDRMLKTEPTKEILKAALPHLANFIDENEPETYYYLLDEVERLLLTELRKIVEGKDADQAAAVRAKEIMEAVKKTERDHTHQQVETQLGDRR